MGGGSALALPGKASSLGMEWYVAQSHSGKIQHDHFALSASMKRSASPEVLAHLPLDRGAASPLHRQLCDALREAILGGLLRPGQRCPSTRALAEDLGVSRLTVLSAYEQLVHEGYLRGRVGFGTIVSPRLPAEAPLAESGHAGGRPGVPPPRDVGGLRPFRLSLPALDRFPVALWGRLAARHARALTPDQMAYGDPAGLGALRDAIAEHLRTSRAVRCEASDVVVVSGSQMALRVCADVLLKPGDRVAVEEPGYPGAHVALSAGGAELVPVPVDGEGLVVEALSALGPRVRAVYVTPSHQYPLGASMSAARRLALLDWAERSSAWIIEDDYDSEYRYVSRPLGALQGMGGSGRVLYVGTFSKVLFPSLRIGYLVVPETLAPAVLAAREALDLFSPALPQLVLVEFLREGHFARHVRRTRGEYARRRRALLEGLERHCGGLLAVHNADAGLHVATTLPQGVDDAALVARLAEEGLTATALSSCYLGRDRRSGLLLGFGGADVEATAAATERLGATLRAALTP